VRQFLCTYDYVREVLNFVTVRVAHNDPWVPTLYFIAGTVFWAPWSRVLFRDFPFAELVNTFYTFYGTQNFIII